MHDDFVIVGHIVEYPKKRLKRDDNGHWVVIAELSTASQIVVDQICVLSEAE